MLKKKKTSNKQKYEGLHGNTERKVQGPHSNGVKLHG